ncbi:hypothetical protein PPL_12106 [Heterostelium album PN500]|uniref:Uncharacterized protein n=1 Tax=Heterostelium pallidum (strain ATCC 26659 / Pp 5 / PN500) TaxID=670386 RepID=D3BLQ3_HETP5|nr:hypothetical protein PPL_12106 [Heterostelium album PN500]EFA77504.1 hypothetical protein PPL_12106 [Heterostelium album PN500]|eukprot:XP_020429632.1 hypothetical protein PPL_12106 [Heterostelium album PN500]
MLKYTIFTIFAYLTISVGQYNWFLDPSPCSKPLLVNVTYSNGVYSSFKASDATTTYLTNVTVNSDATFNGFAALYNGTPKRIIGYTTIKGVLRNPFNLIIIYNPAPSLHFPGSTDYYNLVSCSKS